MVTFTKQDTRVVELVDTPDLKSCGLQGPYGFDSRPGYMRGLFGFKLESPFFIFAGIRTVGLRLNHFSYPVYDTWSNESFYDLIFSLT